MKKAFAIFLVLILLVPIVSFASVPDISGLSYDELVELKNQINLAMWNSKEWQEVTVPVGLWKIGEDIPAGKWNLTVSPGSSYGYAHFYYFDKLDKSGLQPDNQFYCDIYVSQGLDSVEETEGKRPTSIEIDFKPGTYLLIEYASLIFTPPVGKPDLGFK